MKHSEKAALWAMLLLFAALNVREFAQQQGTFSRGGADFKIFYTGASVIALGQGAHLYDLRMQSLVQYTAYPPSSRNVATLPFNHPAYELLLFVPLAFLAPLQAYYLWMALNVCMLIISGALLGRVIHPSAPVALWITASAPVVTALLQGQDSILILFLYSSTYFLLRKEKETSAGVVLALALFKFHLVLPFVLVFVIARRMWRMLSGFAVSAIVLVAVSVVMTGLTGALHYPAFQLELQQNQPWMFLPVHMINLHGLITTYVPSSTGKFVTLIGSVLVLAMVFWVNARRAKDDLDLSFILAILCTLLVCYHSFAHDMSLILLPLLLCARPPTSRSQLFVCACGVLLITPISYLYVAPRSLLCVALIGMAVGVFHSLEEPPAASQRIPC